MHIRAEIVRWVDDDPQPGIVECRFADASGRSHSFVGKYYDFTDTELDSNTSYPQPGIILCEIASRWRDNQGNDLAEVETDQIGSSLGHESVDGLSCFVVQFSQLEDRTSQEMFRFLAWFIGIVGGLWLGLKIAITLFPYANPQVVVLSVAGPEIAILYGIGVWRRRNMLKGACPYCGRKTLERGKGRSLATLGLLLPVIRCTAGDHCGYLRALWRDWVRGTN